MPIVSILIVIVLAAVALYVVEHFISDIKLRKILKIVVILLVLLWLLGMFLGGIQAPYLH